VTPRPTRLVLLGHPVRHSLSPVFQQAALDAAGIALRFETLDVPPATLDTTLDSLVAAGAAGNATIPHKVAVHARCAMRTPVAERTGAVNCWWVEDGRLQGDNTDVAGFDDAVRTLLGDLPSGARIALLGAGGAARAVATAVADWPGASLAIVNRSSSRAHDVAALGPAGRTSVEETMADALRDADLVVNATSLGLRDDDPLVVDPATLRAGTACVDLVYRPDVTPWVRRARDRGLPAIDGLAMLVGQGARAFERWLGVPADRDAMWRALGRAP
jgi:shikimate dehydrogenase